MSSQPRARAKIAAVDTILPYEFNTSESESDEPTPIRAVAISEPPAALPQNLADKTSAQPDLKALPNTGAGNPIAQTAAVVSKKPPAVPLHGKLTTAGFSIVYVLDRSGSMGQGKKLVHAVNILKESLHQLGPQVSFQIVTYDKQATVSRLHNKLELAPAEPATIAEAGRLLDGLVAEGSSRHVEGLRAALSLHPNVVILLSDAGDLTAQDVKQIRQWNYSRAAIHAVLIGATDYEGVVSLRELTGAIDFTLSRCQTRNRRRRKPALAFFDQYLFHCIDPGGMIVQTGARVQNFAARLLEMFR